MIFKACARVDPRAIYGKPFCDLSLKQQFSLLGFEYLCESEEAKLLEAQYGNR